MTPAKHVNGQGPATSSAHVPFAQRLTTRVCAAVAAALLAVVVAVVLVDQAWVRAREIDELRSQASAMAASLSQPLADALASGRAEDAHHLVSVVSKQAGVHRAALFTSEGSVAMTSRELHPSPAPHKNGPGCFMCHPVGTAARHSGGLLLSNHGEHIFRYMESIGPPDGCPSCPPQTSARKGSLLLDFATTGIERELTDHRKVTALLAGATMIAVILLVFLLMQRIVNRPLTSLIDATQRVQAGDLDVRLNAGRSDEIGSLRTAFNAMTTQLQRHTLNLETLVEQRTRESEDLSLELRETQIALMQSSRLATLGEMAAAVAHEIRTPLNALVLNLHMVKKALRDAESSGLEEANVIEQEIRRVDGVIQRFLSMARFPAARIETIDINQLAGTVISFMEPECRRHGVVVETHFATPAPMALHDADRVRQVLLNLILNAAQLMQNGGVVAIRTQRERPQIMVSDTGPGVAPDVRDKIFQPFFSTRKGGTGLGLAVAARLLREHGGDVRCLDCESGAVFAVDLPIPEAS